MQTMHVLKTATYHLLLASNCLQLVWSMSFYEQILQIGLTNSYEQTYSNESPRHNSNYDFIIVGGGSAGCALASRLSENPAWSVYLIEAGGLENFGHLVPVLAPYISVTHSNWGYMSVPQQHACYGMRNNECALPHGKVLGGSSSINFMIYNRGNRHDFDRWAAAGNTGWSYAEVLPYFLKAEGARLAGLEFSPYHNRTGPLGVEYISFRTDLAHAFVQGAQEAGHSKTDYNGATQLGVSYVQATTRNGRRNSAFRAYIEPIHKRRKNLHILTFARVTRVIIDEKTKAAIGVEVIHKRRKYTLHARKEVILSAGSFNSPQLLMLSGVGPTERLRAVGVPVLKDLPVGVRMYDHMCHFGPTFVTNTTGQTTFTSRVGLKDLSDYFLLRSANTRLSTIGGVETLTFLKVPRSEEPHDMPDIELITVAGSLASDEGTALKEAANFKDEIYNTVYRPLELAQQDHFSFLIMHFHPQSVGSIWLRSSNPLHWPIIDPKFFSNEEDVEYILDGIKAAIRITESPTMRSIGTRLHDIPLPGCEHLPFNTDDYWRCSIRTMSYTLHHQVATCRMGPETDASTVVNPQLKVHGIRKLRVVDTSIIPFPPTAHTNAAAIMIGEKAADMISDEWL